MTKQYLLNLKGSGLQNIMELLSLYFCEHVKGYFFKEKKYFHFQKQFSVLGNTLIHWLQLHI